MKEQIEMPKGIFYLITVTSAVIILLLSLEALFRAKDIDLFNAWIANPKLNTALAGETREQLFSTYLSMCLSTFVVRVITPMGVAIHSYFAFSKLRVNKLFVIIWTVLIIGTVTFSIIGQSFISIFFILSGLGYLVILLALVLLWRNIKIVQYL